MRRQEKVWSCGPAALVNAAQALGKRVSEARIRRLAGTTEAAGTDEHGLIAAARELRLSASPSSSADAAAAWALVRSGILGGRPSLLCIDGWGHWVTAVGIVGDRVLVFDPSNGVRNMLENGTRSLSRRELLRRWRHKTAEEPYYAIAIGR